MEEIILNVIPQCNLIISQPVSEKYKGNDIFSTRKLRETADKHGIKHLVMTNCYFTGYDSIPFQITNSDGGIISSDNISYFPSLAFKSILCGDIQKAAKDWCNPTAYTISEMKTSYERSMDELRSRENKIFDLNFGIDIRIADFIEENWKEVLTFHTYNHPTNILLLELARRTANKVGLVLENIVLEEELLGQYSIPPPPCLYDSMKLNFKAPSFMIDGFAHTTKSAMTVYSQALKNMSESDSERLNSGLAWSRSKLN